ncbi:MAG: NAD(P)-dependent oxidoreductase [Bacteroidetes bacterium]|nr:NAD(P)-dependent oxidoreductase [Bacteroidota bacterium]
MKILVTGGAGFIGSAIVPKMQKEGHEVYVLDNLSFGNRDFISVDDAHFFQGDIREADFVTQTLKSIEPEAIVHLAAIHFIPYCNANPFESADINIRGTMNVLNAAKKLKNLKKVFFASTAAVYPISDHAVDENHTLLPLDIYGLTKLTGEHLCREFQLQTGVDTICCRFFNAFGPNETNPHLIPEIEKQLRNGARSIALGNLAPKRDFIHTFDMANAVYALVMLENTGYDTFNLGRGIEYAVTEIVQTFEQLLGEKITVEIDPARTRKVERMHLLANVDKLKNRTGWAPNWSIEEGIKDLIANWN